MYISDSWQNIVAAHKEVGKPLCPETIAELKEVAANPRAKNCQWAVFVAECRICMVVEIVIIPFLPDADLDNIECTNCNNYSMQERELEEWQMSSEDELT